MRFAYDPRKSALNVEKHGISFKEAKGMWDDRNLIVAQSNKHGESRWVAIAGLDGSYWTSIYTIRDSAVRIISVRRATKKEVACYDKANS